MGAGVGAGGVQEVGGRRARVQAGKSWGVREKEVQAGQRQSSRSRGVPTVVRGMPRDARPARSTGRACPLHPDARLPPQPCLASWQEASRSNARSG